MSVSCIPHYVIYTPLLLRIVESLKNLTSASTGYNELTTSKNIAAIKITAGQDNTPGGGIPKFYLPDETNVTEPTGLRDLAANGTAADVLVMVKDLETYPAFLVASDFLLFFFFFFLQRKYLITSSSIVTSKFTRSRLKKVQLQPR